MSARLDPQTAEAQRRLVGEALAALGKRNLLLSIQDPSFPHSEGEDLGRGSPYSCGGAGFLDFAARLGFQGVLFGPQGQTSHVNASPYDGTLFSRSVLSIALGPLTEAEWEGVLARDVLEQLVAAAPPEGAHRVPYHHVFTAQRVALRSAYARFRSLKSASPLTARLASFVSENRDWLERDAGFEALLIDSGSGAAATTPEDRDYYRFCQFVAHEQHRQLRQRTRALGLKLYGDLQIGVSFQDRCVLGPLFLEDYLMGAPPSRTNPAGQPWAYPVFDPRKYWSSDGRAPGPVLRLLRERIGKLLAEFDGLRIDHPHGLICPWVYRADAADPLAAVQAGARLFSSPDLPDHPDLARHAIARAEQLNRDVPRHADDWVRELSDAQVDRYSSLFDVVIDSVREHGREVADILCEVLSTQPYPLRRVMARHHMGRFRVTQKADLTNPADGYRSENAQPADWIMIGNHDTPPIYLLIERWQQAGTLAAHARYLAERLVPAAEAERRPAFAARLQAEPGLLAQAQLAELFASPAENLLVFFADLLGLTAIYNQPGVISDDNWSLRVPPDYAADYCRKLTTDAALNLPLALALALRARGSELRIAHRELITRLEQLAAELRGSAYPLGD